MGDLYAPSCISELLAGRTVNVGTSLCVYTKVRRLLINNNNNNVGNKLRPRYKNRLMLWFRWSGDGLSPRRRGFEPRSAHVRFLFDKLGQVHVFLQVFLFSPVIIVPRVHVYKLFYLNDARIRRTSGRSLETFK